METIHNTKSYTRGYEDGYERGVYDNPYDGSKNPICHLQYKWGYDAGISAYCRKYHPEDEEA